MFAVYIVFATHKLQTKVPQSSRYVEEVTVKPLKEDVFVELKISIRFYQNDLF